MYLAVDRGHCGQSDRCEVTQPPYAAICDALFSDTLANVYFLAVFGTVAFVCKNDTVALPCTISAF